MPGPCNTKRNGKGAKKAQKKQHNKADKAPKQVQIPKAPEQCRILGPSSVSPKLNRNSRASRKAKSPVKEITDFGPDFYYEDYKLGPNYYYEDRKRVDSHVYVPEEPFIYDPGTGPRVRNTRKFLESKFFAQPPDWEDPMCAELAQEEVIQMLMTVLPEETALLLWYNKTRATSRICPACQRLYRVGDILSDPVPSDKSPPLRKAQPPQLRREQELSGLCSPMCFIVACFNYPAAIKSAWGRTEEEIDDQTWEVINGPPANNTKDETGVTLGLLMKMTRLHDLGLAQLCLGIEDLDEE